MSEADYTRALKERDSLAAVLRSTNAELDGFRFNPARMSALARMALDSGQLDSARNIAIELVRRHPQAVEAGQAQELATRATRMLEERATRADREREQASRLAEQRRGDSTRAAEARRTSALRAMRRKHDDVQDVTWYYAPWNSQYVNGRSELLLYISHPKGSSPSLWFTIRYVADEWLFIQSYTIKADEETFAIDASGFNDVERDNGGGDIWEWYSTSAGPDELAMTRAVVASKRAVIRYTGRQYRKDRTISASEKQALRQVLDAYEVLRGQR